MNDPYLALRDGCGFIADAARTKIEFAGRDRATFLHNFCTNDIKRLALGQGCEAFVTSVQGKVLSFVQFFCREESLLLDTVPGEAERLMAHFDRYLIREEVTIINRTEELAECWLLGPTSTANIEAISGVPCAREPACGGEFDFAGGRLIARSVNLPPRPLSEPLAWLVAGPNGAMDAFLEQLQTRGAVACGSEAFESLRIELGYPLYGRDITADNLPQEVDRDALAISFRKGCYLGQETVARIDALGHVNRLLTRLRFLDDASAPESTAPQLAAGLELQHEGKAAGHITSIAPFATAAGTVALGYVRAAQRQAGNVLTSICGNWQIAVDD